MTFADCRTTGFAFGANCTPPALVGGYVCGSLDALRQVVTAEPLFCAYHELDLPAEFDTDKEAYETVFRYPRAEYFAHVRQHGSPKGYAGPAACCRLPWDIDREADLDAALGDCRKLARYIRARYGEFAERGLSVWFSGSKGFHVTLLSVPGFDPLPRTPGVVKALALALARDAGVTVDRTIYDRQRLFRLPNTRHPKTGLFKRFLDLDDLDRLSVAAIRAAAAHPAGFPVPTVEHGSDQLADDWQKAERAVLDDNTGSANGPGRVPPSCSPVVPKFVLDFIGFGDIQDPGRAMTLFRCAAVLAEAGTPAPVVFGLLREPAEKSGLDPAEVDRQIRAGIEHGTRCAKAVRA
ncbi:hypothetical protein [Fimbriiglobus ruber]|uniref:Phage protein n=1 Tax=Fimbriiglobus ruber TaxID=1908690 RepID=A0A225DGK8_9BACT|nr:hypothetical protein [Fimbriiglobus ruber]OWK35545.1 Phage protein [Fimbriiglobus ruber]